MDLSSKTVSFADNGKRYDTSMQVEEICHAMEGREVEKLVLQGNTFGIEAAERLGLELARHSSLREAHFKDLFTSRGREEVPVAVDHILRGIMNSGAQLVLLDLSDNAIGPIGAPPVVEFLESESAEMLEILHLNNCGLGPEGSTSIARTMSRLKHLRELVCGRNRLENKGATNMSAALLNVKNLQVLRMPQNGIQVDGIKEIAKVLSACSETIEEVDLSDNTIKAEGSRALAEPIMKAKRLSILKLNDALLENQGLTIICDALSKCPSLWCLQQVSFEGNEIHGQKIIDIIRTTFSPCQSDCKVNLLDNDFNTQEKLRLKQLAVGFELITDTDSESDSESKSEADSQPEQESESCSKSDVREIVLDFIQAATHEPHMVHDLFMELVSTNNFEIICEELGLIKCESTKMKKPLARDAISYMMKHRNALPDIFKDFLEVSSPNI